MIYRLSVEHFGKEVRELKTSLKQMGNKMKAAPKDFTKQMDEFMEVKTRLYMANLYCVADGK